MNKFSLIKAKGVLVILALTAIGCSSVSEELQVNISSDVLQAYMQLDKSKQILDINKAKINVLSKTEAQMVWFKMRMTSTEQGDVKHERQTVTLNWELVNKNWKITSKKIKSKSEFINLLHKKPYKQEKN